jgi:hypothetical protein
MTYNIGNLGPGTDTEMYYLPVQMGWGIYYRTPICISFTYDLQNIKLKTLGSVSFLLAATLYQGNPKNHKLWNIASTERYKFCLIF